MNLLRLLPDKLQALLQRYLDDGLDGSLTIHFAKGRVAKWESKFVERP